MSKLLFTVLLTLLSATFTFAQTKTNEQITAQMKSLNVGKNIQLEYDKSSDYSKLLILSNEFADEIMKKNGVSSLTFGMMYGYNGQKLTFTPDVFVLTFWARGKNTKFAESHNWKAVTDNETIDLGEARYAKRNGDPREFLNFSITRENLQKISQSKSVKFIIGKTEFAVNAEQLRMFANFLTVSDSSK
jgi:hypothetical protein